MGKSEKRGKQVQRIKGDKSSQVREATMENGAKLSTRSMGTEGQKVTQGPWGDSGNRCTSAPVWPEGPKEMRLKVQEGLVCQRGCVVGGTVHDLDSLEHNTEFSQRWQGGQRGQSGQIGQKEGPEGQ